MRSDSEMTLCPICQSRSSVLRIFQAPDILLKRCEGCRCEFLDPQPDCHQLEVEYRDYFHRRDSGIAEAKKDYFKHILLSTGIDFSRKSILDVGAAEGACAQAVRELWPDANITAIESRMESPPWAATQRISWIKLEIEKWIEREREISSKFDFILIFDVLEHLSAPSTTLQKISRCALNPGGKILGTFPNADSLTRKALGRFWPQYKLEHLFYFSSLSIEKLSDLADLKTLTLRPLKKRLPLGYFMTIGGNFGPPISRKIVQLVNDTSPRWLRQKSAALPTGEWIWIAAKEAR